MIRFLRREGVGYFNDGFQRVGNSKVRTQKILPPAEALINYPLSAYPRSSEAGKLPKTFYRKDASSQEGQEISGERRRGVIIKTSTREARSRQKQAEAGRIASSSGGSSLSFNLFEPLLGRLAYPGVAVVFNDFFQHRRVAFRGSGLFPDLGVGPGEFRQKQVAELHW
jgi:hypothetical protein